MTTEELEKRIIKIEERNIKVETNKAWETSITRKLALIVITYFAVGVTLWTMGNPDPWLTQLFPRWDFYYQH